MNPIGLALPAEAAPLEATADAERATNPPLPSLTAAQAVALEDACAHGGDAPDGTSYFVLGGLHCAACAGLIETAAARVPGLLRADVNAASRRLRVQWDTSPDTASEPAGRVAALVNAVRQAGYTLHPAEAKPDAVARRDDARAALWRLFVAGFCMMQVMMLTTPAYLAAPGDIAPDLDALMRWAAWVLSLPVLLFSAGPFLRGAWRAVRARRIGMDVPVALGIAITFIAGTGATFDPGGVFGHEAYLDSLTMFITFLLAGRWLESRARGQSTEALDALLQRLPEAVQRLAADGTAELVPVARLRVGDRVRVALGQAFPGDGVLIESDTGSNTQVDEALLTGESLPVPRRAGDRLSAGTLNVGAPVVVLLDGLGPGTRYGQIVDLMQRALGERPTSLRLADRWAGPFLWAVLLLAAGAAAVWRMHDPARAAWVAVSVLIVTCPCALSLAAPAALISATGALARRGVLVQRLDALEALAGIDIACFDKTGTLTQDRLVLARIDRGPADPGGPDDGAAVDDQHDPLLAGALSLAALSQHPVSRALGQCMDRPMAPPSPTLRWHGAHEVPGCGIEAHDAHGRLWRLGSPRWAGVPPADGVGRVQLACVRHAGPAEAASNEPARWLRFAFDESLRDDAVDVLSKLRAQGIDVRILSGDATPHVQDVARRLGVNRAWGNQSPEDKLAAVRRWQAEGHRVLMVGDGVNDGPVLTCADVSMALSHGSALAQQRADFVVLGSHLAEVAEARDLARRSVRIVRQNLAWSAFYNAACIPLALAALLPPWAAGAGMAASSLGVVLNALRLVR